MKVLHGHHHITLGVGGAQEDYDFHTRLLGLRSAILIMKIAFLGALRKTTGDS